MILKIAITWLILDAIVCAGWALIRANQRSRQNESRDVAERQLEWGEFISHFGGLNK